MKSDCKKDEKLINFSTKAFLLLSLNLKVSILRRHSEDI